MVELHSLGLAEIDSVCHKVLGEVAEAHFESLNKDEMV